MSITDELRTWMYGHTVNCSDDRIALVAIADRIDAEHDERYVALPVDADGVPLKVGDVVTMQLLFGGESKPLVVDRMELSHGRDGDLWCVALDTDKECWNQPSLMRHYTPPTVEDVLREFADRVCNSGHQWGLDAPDVIPEYAAKLRLKEDA